MTRGDIIPSTSFSARKRWLIALHTAGAISALIAIVCMINYLACRHFKRFYWNDRDPLLSPLTTSVLDSVTNQVKAVVFFDRNRPFFGVVSDLLDAYRSRCPRISIEYVDHVRSRDRAKVIQDRYKLDPNEPADRIIFDSNGRSHVVYARDLAEYDYSAMLRGEEVKRSGFRGEQLFTAALYKLIDPQPMAAYFWNGHGEHDPLDQSNQFGYYQFSRILAENNITVRTLSSRDEIPPDCQLLVIAGPRGGFLPGDLDRLQQYLDRGGRLFVLFNYLARVQPTGLERILAHWGVDVGFDQVVDPQHQKSGEENLLVANQFGAHPVVQSLQRSGIALMMPRSITAQQGRPLSASAPKATVLVQTSPQGQALTQENRRLVVRKTGSIPLAAAVEMASIKGISSDRGATRIVVAGDSFFLGNAMMELEANRDFARNAVNWLLNRELLLEGIGPHPVHEYQITITQSEMTGLLWLFLVIAPGSVAILGGIVWLRRRN